MAGSDLPIMALINQFSLAVATEMSHRHPHPQAFSHAPVCPWHTDERYKEGMRSEPDAETFFAYGLCKCPCEDSIGMDYAVVWRERQLAWSVLLSL